MDAESNAKAGVVLIVGPQLSVQYLQLTTGGIML